MSGQVVVVTVTTVPRKAKKGPVLCPACTVTPPGQKTILVKNRAPVDFWGPFLFRAEAGEHKERDICASPSLCCYSLTMMPCDYGDEDEYTNLSFTSASCSFYSYTPHFPSSAPSCLISLYPYCNRYSGTCQWVQSEEIWQLCIFEPLSGLTINKHLTISQVREHIDEIVDASQLMKKGIREQLLVGKSFGLLEPLFMHTGVAFDGRLDMSYNYACRKAAEENSLLPLLPKVPGELVCDSLLNAIGKRRNLAIDQLYPTGYILSQKMLQIRGIDELESYQECDWVWEPLADCLYALRHIERVKHHELQLEERVKALEIEIEKLVLGLEFFMSTEAEKVPMQYEDARMTFIRTNEKLEAAKERIRRVMQYSKRNIEEMDAHESNQSEDWKQDYDGLEDGSAWKGLNDSRKIEKWWSIHLQDYLNKYKLCPPLIPKQQQMEAELTRVRTLLRNAKQQVVDYAPTLGKVQAIYTQVRTLASKAIQAALAPLGMPRKVVAPTKRRVQRTNYKLVFIRDPLVRCQPKYLGCWSLLHREPMALRPIKNVNGGRSVLRCVVEVFRDPVTQYILIRLLQDESPTEESAQHIGEHLSPLNDTPYAMICL